MYDVLVVVEFVMVRIDLVADPQKRDYGPPPLNTYFSNAIRKFINLLLLLLLLDKKIINIYRVVCQGVFNFFDTLKVARIARVYFK